MASSTESTRTDKRGEKGFALIVVLWLGVLLALLAAGFSSSVRSRLRGVSAEADLVRAEAYADAGARIALLTLMNREPQQAAGGGAPLLCSIDQAASLMLVVTDEEGRVSLNSAGEALLSALFAGLGANPDDARRYAEAIIDFRDADDDKLPDGAERDDYIKLGHALGPKNARFASLDELDQVAGLPPALRDRAKAYLSAVSMSAGIDEGVAGPELNDILVRGSGGIAVPLEGGPQAGATSISTGLPLTFKSVSTRKLYRIGAEAILENGSRFTREAIVTLPDGPISEPRFQRWRRGERIWKTETVPAPAQLKPC